MSSYRDPHNRDCFPDVPVISILFCTEELRYTDPESRFIHIPKDIYFNFLEIKRREGKATLPLFVGVRNNLDVKKRLYFGRVEPSIVTENSTHDNILLPEWAINLLGIESIGSTLDLVYESRPFSIGYMKVRGNKSCYAKFKDVKLMLEQKLSNYNCLNLNETFSISEGEDVLFTITSLKDKDGNEIDCGAIYNVEVKIDFDIPDDLVEIERLKKLNPVEPVKMNPHREFGSKIHTFSEIGEEEHKSDYKPFEGPGLKLTEESQRKLTRQELAELRLKKMGLN